MGTKALVVGQSANHAVQIKSLDGGGTRGASANYSNDGSIGGFGGLVTASTPQETDRNGYVGQLYEVTAFTLPAPSTNLDENTSMTLAAHQFLDDGTASPANSFAQWSFNGPLVGVDSGGILTAGDVSQNTPATVRAGLEGWSASLNPMVVFTGVLPAYNQITSQLLNGNTLRLSFLGSNGINYALDRSHNLSAPVAWAPHSTNPAGVNGFLIFTNSANTTTNNFWRIRSVP